MKTTFYSSEQLRNARLVFLVLLLVLLFAGVASFAQYPAVRHKATHPAEADKKANALNSFTVREYDGKLYFQITVLKDTVEGLFVLEKSTDGNNYEPVSVARNVPSSINAPILYCFTEDKLPGNRAGYRVMKYGPDQIEFLVDYIYTTDDQNQIPSLPDDPDEAFAETLHTE